MPCVCETEETLLPDIHTQELLDLGKAPCVSLIKVQFIWLSIGYQSIMLTDDPISSLNYCLKLKLQ